MRHLRQRAGIVLLPMLLLAGFAHALERTAGPLAEPGKVMIMGVFHFANPGRDMVKSKVIDVATPGNQVYLDGLATRIAAFKPTDVLIECDLEDQKDYDADSACHRRSPIVCDTWLMNRLLIALGCVFLSVAINAPARAAEPNASAIRTIVIVRHGNYAADPGIDEKIGPQLSPIGVAQAHLAGAALMGLPVHFDHLYTSPMQRARDTAATIAGDFPGRKFEVLEDLAECTPPTRRSEITKDEKPEDLAACKQKLDGVFARFFKPGTAGDQADMLVCHGNVTRYLVTRALGVDTEAWLEMSVGHASITTIRVEADGRFKVIAVGDVGHIPSNMRTGARGDAGRTLAIPQLPEITPAH